MNQHLIARLAEEWAQLDPTDPLRGLISDAIAEINKQPAQQEPVAWMSPSWIDPDTRGWQSDSFESIPIEGWLPIYTSPPAQRTWVSLTDEEVDTFLKAVWGREVTPKHFIQAIEARLKELNT